MEILKISDFISFSDEKPVIRTLFPGPGSRVLLICLRSGQGVPEHSTPDPIAVLGMTGRAAFYDGSAQFPMESGTLIRLEAGRPHRIEAYEDTVLLVTVIAAVRTVQGQPQ